MHFETLNKKFLILIFLPLCILTAQSDKNIDQTIKYQSKELEKIRREISEFQKQLKQVETKEKSILTKLTETEENIALTEKMIAQLNREISLKEREIKNIEKSIKELESNLSDLKTKFARRLVYLYKNGDYSDLELLLTSRSLNEAFYRYKYLRILAEIDQKNSRTIKNNINLISSKKEQLQKELRNLSAMLAEKKAYQKVLAQQKELRQRQLNEAKQNKSAILQQLKEKQKAAEKIEKLIASLEKEREKRRIELEKQREKIGIVETNPFLKQKGQLDWPVYGKIFAQFGIQIHPTLKTKTENSGIDIQAPKGTPVRAIMDGMVTTVTYIRGFGNTVIIDHGSGFYTVYSHLENISINDGDYVAKGSIIGEVGESGSLNGPMLHFEIWHNKNKLNPEEWLAKRK